MRVIAVIPTLNEEHSVSNVIQGCLPHVNEVVVVDGDSTDGTCEVAAASGACVIRLKRRGKGRAVQCAIARIDADIVLFIDADDSHDTADIPILLKPLLEENASLVIASRVTGGSDELEGDHGHFLRAIGTKSLQALVNRRLHIELTDIQNGFRAIKTTVARQLDLREPGFCIEQEMAVKCIRQGYRVVNVPSHEYRRRYGKSRLNLWRVAPRCLWNMAVLLFAPVPRASLP